MRGVDKEKEGRDERKANLLVLLEYNLAPKTTDRLKRDEDDD